MKFNWTFLSFIFFFLSNLLSLVIVKKLNWNKWNKKMIGARNRWPHRMHMNAKFQLMSWNHCVVSQFKCMAFNWWYKTAIGFYCNFHWTFKSNITTNNNKYQQHLLLSNRNDISLHFFFPEKKANAKRRKILCAQILYAMYTVILNRLFSLVVCLFMVCETDTYVIQTKKK